MTAELTVGTRFGGSEPAHLWAPRLNRHTFWCGQSGSGKTYALGVLLEQVLLHTRLPLVILDPNGDFVRLPEIREDAPADLAAELAARDIRVCGAGPDATDPLHIRYLNMQLTSRAALLQVDPVEDPDDFNALLRIDAKIRDAMDVIGLAAGERQSLGLRDSLVQWLRAQPDPEFSRLAIRLENLGVADWTLWAWGDRGAVDVIDARPDATVVDLSGFDTGVEPRAAALAILDHLWAHRHERIGRLIVIDEAHNLCPPNPVTPIQKLLTERIVQIAAEGRKYGLWLLMSTQRPSKVHPNALSQCDNLGLMRMSSPRDLAELGSVFGYAPDELREQATGFGQGQVLFAGGFAAEPMLVQMGPRLTREGGADVPVELR
ncbi:ATP-binding protein [Gordonia caeni]|uniref:Helicase HerA central domain-containing protein n=1 Tax=Gordonia caeni TaxID=1007097 RepID=A0ABP7P1M6_9ACTN